MITVNFDPFPILETERLVLRDVRLTDKEDLFLIRSHPETMRFIPRPIAETVDDVVPLIETVQGFVKTNERINWAITEKGKDNLIGMIGYVKITLDNHRAEVGYALNHTYQRKGIMLEALGAVMDYGFDVMRLRSVEAVIHPDNAASRGIVEKYGFTKDAYFKDYNFHREQFVDALVYSFITPHK